MNYEYYIQKPGSTNCPISTNAMDISEQMDEAITHNGILNDYLPSLAAFAFATRWMNNINIKYMHKMKG